MILMVPRGLRLMDTWRGALLAVSLCVFVLPVYMMMKWFGKFVWRD